MIAVNKHCNKLLNYFLFYDTCYTTLNSVVIASSFSDFVA
jgi:hypothetical protein